MSKVIKSGRGKPADSPTIGFQAEIAEISGLMDGGRWVIAEGRLQRLAKRFTKSPVTWQLLGRCLLKLRRYTEAVDALSQAVKFNPKGIPAHLDLAQVLLEQSRFDLATEVLDQLDHKQGRRIAASIPLRRAAAQKAQTSGPISKIATLIAEIDKLLEQGDIDKALAIQKELKNYSSTLREVHWGQEALLARAAYFCFNPLSKETLASYSPRWFDAAVEFDFVTWPRRVHEWVEGRTIADVGCGHGAYSLGFIIAGAKTYSGLDPVIDLDSDRARNKRLRIDAPFPCTPREITARFKNVEIRPGNFEEVGHTRSFDSIILHNVSEHLMNIEHVFEDLRDIMHSESKLVFLHHNFYCWNGHHLSPKSLSSLNESDSEQQKYYDWRHIRYQPSSDHYISTSLNRIRLDDLRNLCERLYDVEVWEEHQSAPNTLARLTPEIRAGLPEFSERELAVNSVFIVARLKGPH